MNLNDCMLAGKLPLPHCYWDFWRLPSALPPLEPCPTLSHSSEKTRLLGIGSCFQNKIITMYTIHYSEGKYGGLTIPVPVVKSTVVLWIRIGFNEDPDPAFFLSMRIRMRIRIQGSDYQKLKYFTDEIKTFFFIKNCNLIIPRPP
jgi:hypothetical protein